MTPPNHRGVRLGVVADDLTGGSTVAGELARWGMEATLTSLDGPSPSGHGAWVIDLGSREASEASNRNAARTAVDRLGAWGADHLMVKIDSLDRGHPAAIVAAVAERSPVMVVSAPSPESVLPRWWRPSLPELQTAGGGTDATHDAARWWLLAQPTVAEMLDAQVRGCRTWIGAYGVMDTLAASFTSASTAGVPVLAVVGSFDENAARQVRAAKQLGCEHVRVATSDCGASALDNAVLGAHSALMQGRAVVLTSETLASDPSAKHVCPDRPSPAVSIALARVAQAIVDGGGVAGLVLTGGETARAVSRALGCFSWRTTGREAFAGAPLLIVERTGGMPLHVVTKPGALGDDLALWRCLTSVARIDPTAF